MKRALLLFALVMLLPLFFLGVPQDAIRAYRGTHAGDRVRLFQYYQTARWYGVPAALDLYGVEPNRNSETEAQKK